MNDSTSIHFNANGATHSLRIRPIDTKPGEVTVFEGMVDANTLYWFESYENIEVWELIELAIEQYLLYRVEDQVITTEWRK
jgi:hypothetical protein